MALFIRQDENRTKLQERLNTELQERLKRQNPQGGEPESIDKSAYLKDTKDASSLTWVWVVIALVVAGLGGYFIYAGTGQ